MLGADKSDLYKVGCSGEVCLMRARIVIADDQPDVLREIGNLLACHFDVIGVVSNGPALIEAAETLRPELVVLDISMPGMSGLETARRLAARSNPPRLVFLTVHESRAILRDALDTGALGYVVKIRADTDLVAAVREALEGRSYISPCLQS